MEFLKKSLNPIVVTLPLEVQSIDLLSKIVFHRLADMGYPRTFALQMRMRLEIVTEWMETWIEAGGEGRSFTCVLEGFEHASGGYGIRVTLSGSFPPMSGEEFEAFRSRFVEENAFAAVFSDDIFLIGGGTNGQKVVLEKVLPSCETTPERTPHGAEEHAAPARPDRAQQGAESFTIRPLRDERDAIQVARCAYFSYGYDYPSDVVFEPRKLVEANRAGSLVSLLAVNAAGRIAGHVALEMAGAGDRSAELGMAFVHPDFRSQGLLSQLTDKILAHAEAMGLKQIFVSSVTGHTHSQRAAAKQGFVSCALKLGLAPPINIRALSAATTRISTLVQTKRIAAETCANAKRYVPQKHLEAIRAIYSWLGESPELIADDASPCGAPESQPVSAQYAEAFCYSMLEVNRISADAARDLVRAIRTERTREVACMNVLLPLEPGVNVLASVLEARDFYFGGIHPMRDSRDALLMQRLHVENIDMGALALHDENSRRLAAYVERERGA